jgi:diguanylate cyclase (GGDEF)-like protein
MTGERPDRYRSSVRRMLSPTYGARSNAAEALERMADDAPGLVLHGADLALFSGHPAGLSQRRAAGRLGTALWEVFPAPVALLDRDGVIISVNRAWREFGLERGGSSTAEIGTNYLDVCARATDSEPEAVDAAGMIRAALDGLWPEGRLEYPCSGPDEPPRWFALQAIPIPGRHSGALVIHLDVTRYIDREQMWQHRALHDQLTGLPNQALLCQRIDAALSASSRTRRMPALLLLDLDGFGELNDRYGRSAGDDVLRHVAERLDRCVGTKGTVGRWSGSQFLLLLDEIPPQDEADGAEQVAECVRDELRRPVDLGAATVSVSATIGLVHADERRTAQELVDAADHALHEVRQAVWS